MTLTRLVRLIEVRLRAWQREEIAALGEGDAVRARDCRNKASVLDQLRIDAGARDRPAASSLRSVN